MAAVDLHSAVELASAGIVTVLDAQLSTELTAIKASNYNSALPLDAPAKYFEVMSEGAVDSEVRNAGRVACFVYQAGEFVPDEWLSNDPTDRQMTGRTEFGVVVAFHTALYEPWAKPWDATENVTTEEVMVKRARAYAGGVLQTLLKYGCTQSGIEAIELVSNYPAQVEFNEDGRPVIGYAHSVYDVFQHVKYPAPQALP